MQPLCNSTINGLVAVEEQNMEKREREEERERMQRLQKNEACLSSARFLGQHLP